MVGQHQKWKNKTENRNKFRDDRKYLLEQNRRPNKTSFTFVRNFWIALYRLTQIDIWTPVFFFYVNSIPFHWVTTTQMHFWFNFN